LGESPYKNRKIGSLGSNLACEGLRLGMRVEGHKDSKTEAHPRLRMQMNLRSRMKDHTHTFAPFLQGQVTTTEPWYGREAGPEVTPVPSVSRRRRGLNQRSSVCRRSSRPATREGGDALRSHLWCTEIFINLKGL
jgi:hypothetical protein